jgi:hypothetical protein
MKNLKNILFLTAAISLLTTGCSYTKKSEVYPRQIDEETYQYSPNPKHRLVECLERVD